MIAEYFLPFDTAVNPVLISQGNNGPYSHFKHANRQDSRFAIDFALPVGTPILASRAGKIIGVIDNSDKYYDGVNASIGLGLPPGSTNFILIAHGDGTVAFYFHFEMGSASVKLGQRVEQGDSLGRVGNSGWVGPESHVHIQVNNSRTLECIPITFEDYSGPLEHREIYPPAEKENTLI